MSGIKFRRNLKIELQDIQVAEIVYAVDTDEWGLGLSDESVVWRNHVIDFENILLSGVGAPNVSLGKVGFMYVDTTDTNGIFIKNETEWIYKKHPASIEYITANFLPITAGYDETSKLFDTDALQLLIDPGFSATEPLDIISKMALDEFVAVLKNDGSTQMIDGYIPNSNQKPVTLKNLKGGVTMVLSMIRPIEDGILWNDGGTLKISGFVPVRDCSDIPRVVGNPSDSSPDVHYVVNDTETVIYGSGFRRGDGSWNVYAFFRYDLETKIFTDVEFTENQGEGEYMDLFDAWAAKDIKFFNGFLYFTNMNYKSDGKFNYRITKFNADTLELIHTRFSPTSFGTILDYYHPTELGYNENSDTVYLSYSCDGYSDPENQTPENSYRYTNIVRFNADTLELILDASPCANCVEEVQHISTIRGNGRSPYLMNSVFSGNKMVNAISSWETSGQCCYVYQIDCDSGNLDWQTDIPFPVGKQMRDDTYHIVILESGEIMVNTFVEDINTPDGQEAVISKFSVIGEFISQFTLPYKLTDTEDGDMQLNDGKTRNGNPWMYFETESKGEILAMFDLAGENVISEYKFDVDGVPPKSVFQCGDSWFEQMIWTDNYEIDIRKMDEIEMGEIT